MPTHGRARTAPSRPRRRPAGPPPGLPADLPSGLPAGYLGEGADDREFWLVGGHVYCQPPAGRTTHGARESHVCRLTAYNRLRKP